MTLATPRLLAPFALALALFSLACLGTGADPSAAPAFQGQGDRHPLFEHLNLSKKGLALEGHDPVAYFPEHGGKATPGSEKITVNHLGVTYRFASEENRKAFLATPERFEPRYGGWCAWALADGKGDKVDVDPESFVVESGKLYVFYDGFWGDTRKKWKEAGGAAKLAPKGDENWKRITKPKEE
jgi:YHS domain-containing protein